jgi:hypothetical protein
MTTIDVPAPAASGRPAHEHHAPTFGFTRHGHEVHAKVFDHLPDHNFYARFNKKFALMITDNVGTMTCFWVFCVIALVALPSCLQQANIIHHLGVIGSPGFSTMVQWLAAWFIQLVLLPALMVGQNLQNVAADARSAKTFEDVERIIDLLDVKTERGLHDIAVILESLKAEVATLKATT